VLNAIIVLLVVTSVLGPILTERFAKQLPTPADQSMSNQNPEDKVVVPVGEHHALV
jgi:hypothetical protein